MKCPRCGKEMTLDSHRKYDLYMCYECGYMEGRNMGSDEKVTSNFERIRTMNFNEAVSYMASGLGIDEETLSSWLESTD